MKTTTYLKAYIFCVVMISTGATLKCWKCIANDCAYDQEENYKAFKVTCDKGQQCMKVRYQMFDNITYYDSVIRTCTAGPCQITTPSEYQACISTPKHYMISGCSLRSCCADRDLCNEAPVITVQCAIKTVVTCTVVLSYIVKTAFS